MAHENFPPEVSAALSDAPHKLNLDSRSVLSLTGVNDVVSFDEASALFVTSEGLLSIDGEGLHVTRLSVETGEMELCGRVNALIYLDDASNASKQKNGRRRR